jgi:hypothetical protein
MKDDTPHGSVFGGYGFFSYTAMRNRPSAGNNPPPSPRSSGRPGLRLRLLQRGASALLARWTRN